MSLKASSNPVAVDASSIITLVGNPSVAVYWGVSGSAGTLTPLSYATDPSGVAVAIFEPAPGEEGQTATITAEYGT